MRPRIPLAALTALIAIVGAGCASSRLTLDDALPGATGSVPAVSATPSATSSATPAMVKVPNLMFDALDLAQSLAKDDGLTVKVTAYRETVDLLPGIVVAQDPKPAKTVAPGGTVKVTLTKAPACDPAYPTICLAPFQKGVSCKTIPFHNFTVLLPRDPYHLDFNQDGIGCPGKH